MGLDLQSHNEGMVFDSWKTAQHFLSIVQESVEYGESKNVWRTSSRPFEMSL